ncbi:MAG: hypothetical protein WD073_06300 [Xanthobacteraceae bacterium]
MAAMAAPGVSAPGIFDAENLLRGVRADGRRDRDCATGETALFLENAIFRHEPRR